MMSSCLVLMQGHRTAYHLTAKVCICCSPFAIPFVLEPGHKGWDEGGNGVNYWASVGPPGEVHAPRISSYHR